METIGLIVFGKVSKRSLVNSAKYMADILKNNETWLDLYVESNAYKINTSPMSILNAEILYKFCIIIFMNPVPFWLAGKSGDSLSVAWGSEFESYLNIQLSSNRHFPMLSPRISYESAHDDSMVTASLRFNDIRKDQAFLFAQAMDTAGGHTTNHRIF